MKFSAYDKIQGQTFDRVMFYPTSSVFSHGQLLCPELGQITIKPVQRSLDGMQTMMPLLTKLKRYSESR